MIRNATYDDMDELLVIGERMHLMSQFAELGDYNPVVVEKRLMDIMDMGQNGFARVIEVENQIVGFFFGFYLEVSLFGTHTQTLEVALFVEEEYCRLGLATELVQEYINWAKSKRATEIQIDNSTNIDPKHVERFYYKMGFKKIGGVYNIIPDYTGKI